MAGSYPPDKCGVGDYTAQLANALAARPGIEVAVLTSLSAGIPSDLTEVKVFRVMQNWRLRNVLQIKQVISKFRPDVVHIQYPTQGYNGRLPQVFPVVMRLLGFPVVQTWHEHYVECSAVNWLNLLACNGLVYVRPDLVSKLPHWIQVRLRKTPLVYIPNASTIPVARLSVEQEHSIKWELSGGKPIVCYFGFAYPNKGVERLFTIADPSKHHLVLICDLNDEHPYQATILRLMEQAAWKGRVTVTGFQSAQRVGEILAVADAVLFPFPNGAGEWNTSLKAAEEAGAFTVATTQDNDLFGYHESKNIYFADCDQISEMQVALHRYLGTRKKPMIKNVWEEVAMKHEQLYRTL
ncbi:glycosyltransferase involved in cell wall biosynthesis [Herminiimonas fonticola]|uniref:Glycosyltransferase involved in cell wall biosynthesis n=1 Tax=Herminiimonas fonticola TaxID=303380 RepID=A0A4R6G6B3_9BURK|nr:Glycosyl transferase 4-like domain [Herminiimonas fonticola]TDN90013.1 glycosyltransferase involved in cell wall biosynthesis [Herminiimonas fonticola]